MNSFKLNDLLKIGTETLTTTATTLSAAINELVTKIGTINTTLGTHTTNISTNASGIATNKSNISTNATNIATNKSNISTNATNIATNKSNISANATNIANNTDSIAAIKVALGDTDSLSETFADTDFTSIVTALNTELTETKKSASDGKSSLASAITAKGVSTEADATFETMVTNIANIVTTPTSAEIEGSWGEVAHTTVPGDLYVIHTQTNQSNSFGHTSFTNANVLVSYFQDSLIDGVYVSFGTIALVATSTSSAPTLSNTYVRWYHLT